MALYRVVSNGKKKETLGPLQICVSQKMELGQRQNKLTQAIKSLAGPHMCGQKELRHTCVYI